MRENNNDENKCWEKKQAMEECAVGAFKKANTDVTYEF